MKKAALVLVAALVLLVAPFLWGWLHRDDPAPGQAGGLPWQIEDAPGGGKRVMNLEPGRSTLSEARGLWPEGLEVALLAKDDEAGTAQVYVPNVTAGFVTGKIVLTADLGDPAVLVDMKSRAVHKQPTASGGWRYSLSADDEARVWNARIGVLAFHPTARLAEEDLLHRFGEAPERIAGAEGVSHWIYPDRGLTLTRSPTGQCVFQYVPPAAIDALRRQLVRADSVPASAAGSSP